MEGTKIQVGKGSLVFLEAAAELDNVVLTNKSYQTTRFVMATLRGMSTYMTNLPTLYAIHSQTLQECLEISDNTGAKSCMETMKNIGNGEKIAMMIGIHANCWSCILSVLCLHSMQKSSQHQFWRMLFI